jgi:uncharacterized protein YbjT (DUF2867 family)
MKRRIAIVGASGLVGKELLRELLDSTEIESVLALVRRPLNLNDTKLREVKVDFANRAEVGAALAEGRPEELFCCLGTTIKIAGSQEAFRAVDLDAPLVFAKEGLANGAQQFIVCTAVGADPKSRVFYSRTKGELEQSLKALGFARGVKVVQPSMLLGHRVESRPLEKFIAVPMKLSQGAFKGPLWKYRPIEAEKVARAMFNAAFREPPGDRAYQGKALFNLAGFA